MKDKKPPPPPPPPTLDLHGYRKEAAIRAVTDFLDTHRRGHHGSSNNNNTATPSVWVTIITGTGSHSPTGPVLRTAVESLLHRRQMEFVRNTPGSFRVQATSGQAWYHHAAADQAIDTKIITTTDSDPLVRVQRALQKQPKQIAQRANSGGSSASTASTISLSGTFGPSVAEVAQDEATLQKVKEESRQYAQEFAKQQRQQDAQHLEQALRESMDAHRAADKEFAALMEQAVQQSQQEVSQREQEEQAELQRALKESSSLHCRNNVNQSSLTDQELEALTQQALELSMQQQQTSSSQLIDEEEEARLLEEILQRSLYETVGP